MVEDDRVLDFIVGLAIGVAFGMIVVGFLAIGSFDRGWDAALRRRALSQLRHVR